MCMRKFIISIILLVVAFSTTRLVAQYNKYYFYSVGRAAIIDNNYGAAIEMLNIMLKADPEAYEGYFLRGIAKYNLDDLIGAEMDFTQAIYYHPAFTRAFLYRAITRSRLANYDDALNDFAEAIELRPDLPDPYYSRGVTFLLNRQYREAVADLNVFIRRESKVVDAYINRGTAYLQLADTASAYEDYFRAIETNNNSAGAHNRLGSLYAAQEKYDEAITSLTRSLECDSTYIPSLFSRAISYVYSNKPIEAIEDFSSIISLDSTLALAYFNRALVRSQTGDYNRALEDYDEVIYYTPQNVLVYYNRAGLNHRLGNLEQALDDYSQAIELYPDFANAYLGRSNVKYLLDDQVGSRRDEGIANAKIAEYRSKLNDSTFSIYADTSRQFNQLVSFENNNSNFRNIAAQNSNIAMLPLLRFGTAPADTLETIDPHRYYVPAAEEFMAQFEDAPSQTEQYDINVPLVLTMTDGADALPADSLLNLDRVVEREFNSQGNPSWQTLFKRGVTQSQIKQYTNAINSYTSAIERNPMNAFLYLNRGVTRAEMIDFVSSIGGTNSRLTIDNDPANQLRNNSSRTYDYSEAIADMNWAARLYPDYAYIYYNRANLYCLSGRMTEALEDYTRAISLNPSFAHAYYNRGLLQIYLKDTHKGCIDISKAGELGIAQAYDVLKIYARSANR